MGKKSKAEKLLITINDGLKKYSGYRNFRYPQDEIVTRIMSGEDVLAILPTGAGKSLCFQLPAFLMPGITIVITPIIALMTNQVESVNRKLRKKGISDVRAVYANSELGINELKANLNPKDKSIKLVYVSPERLLTSHFQEYVDSIEEVSMVVVDEAHCASMWGYDFRTSYASIPEFINRLSKRPVVAAFTATANEYVAKDIINMLNLRAGEPISVEARRDRLTFSVVDFGQVSKGISLETLKAKKMKRLFEDIKKRGGELGIVYCNTIDQVNEVYDFLSANGIRVSKYHGQGISESEEIEVIDWEEVRKFSKERKKVLRQFLEEETDCMVATNAFGMGIDKEEGRGRDVTYVIHYNIPLNIENYYQEAGRGARWQGTANCDCILYYLKADIRTNKFFIDKMGEGMPDEVRNFLQRLAWDRFGKMLEYVSFKGDRNQFFSDYFEKYVPSVPDNPIAAKWYKSLDGSFDTPTYFYANKTKLAGIFRKPGYELKGELRRRNVESKSYYTEKYEITAEDTLTFFDMLVLDTIYTMKKVGMKEFTTHTILQVMSGDMKADGKSPVRELIAESIAKMQTIQLTIGKETGKLLPDIPMVNKKNSTYYSYVYHKDDTGYNKPLLFRYAEKTTKGMFVRFPIEFLNIRETSNKKSGGNRIFPITKEGLMLEHYLLYKITYIIDANYKINNSINFSFMIKELQITFPKSENGEKMKKERLLENIRRFMDSLMDYGFISGYRLRESRKDTAEIGLAGYEGLEIFSKNKSG